MLKIFYNSDSTENEIINVNFTEVKLVRQPVENSAKFSSRKICLLKVISKCKLFAIHLVLIQAPLIKEEIIR